MKKSASSTVIITAVYLTGIAGTMAEFMVPPVMPLLTKHFRSSRTLESLLMGAFALAAMGAALAAGRLANRLGTNRVASAGILGLVLGTGLSWWAFDRTTMLGFLAARLVGGLGFGLISVAAPAKISRQIRPPLLSRALAIWATWVPVGSLLMFLLGPRLMTARQMTPLSLAEWAIELVAAILLGLTQDDPAEEPRPAKEPHPRGWVPAMLFVGGAFASFTGQQFALSTWLSTWLTHSFSFRLGEAGVIGASASILGAVGNLAGGPFLGSRPKAWPFLGAALLMSGCWLLVAMPNREVAVAGALTINLVGGLIPTLVFAAPRLVTRGALLAPAMAFVIVGENLGILAGPLVDSALLGPSLDFPRAFRDLVILGAVMTLAVGAFFLRQRRIPLADRRPT